MPSLHDKRSLGYLWRLKCNGECFFLLILSKQCSAFMRMFNPLLSRSKSSLYYLQHVLNLSKDSIDQKTWNIIQADTLFFKKTSAN